MTKNVFSIFLKKNHNHIDTCSYVCKLRLYIFFLNLLFTFSLFILPNFLFKHYCFLCNLFPLNFIFEFLTVFRSEMANPYTLNSYQLYFASVLIIQDAGLVNVQIIGDIWSLHIFGNLCNHLHDFFLDLYAKTYILNMGKSLYLWVTRSWLPMKICSVLPSLIQRLVLLTSPHI